MHPSARSRSLMTEHQLERALAELLRSVVQLLHSHQQGLESDTRTI